MSMLSCKRVKAIQGILKDGFITGPQKCRGSGGGDNWRAAIPYMPTKKMDTELNLAETEQRTFHSLEEKEPRSLSLNRRNILVDPAWLDNLISSSSHVPHKPFVILEVSFTEELITNRNFKIEFPDQQGSPYQHSINSAECLKDEDHIPGAIRLHPSYFEAGNDFSKYYPHYETFEDGNLLPDDELIQAVLDLGIDAETLVVVVGNVKPEPNPEKDSTKGHAVSAMAAARVVWSLMYCGVVNVRMLDGGWHAWHVYRKGCHTPLYFQPRKIERPVKFNVSNECTGKDFLATTKEVEEMVNKPSVTRSILLDVRRLGEHNGTKTDAYPFFHIAGSIPNAVYQGNWDVLVDLESGKLKTLDEVETYWRKELGVDFDKYLSGCGSESSDQRGWVIFFCGTGWRSSISFLLAYMMGWPTKNYDDGWYGWCSLMGLKK